MNICPICSTPEKPVQVDGAYQVVWKLDLSQINLAVNGQFMQAGRDKVEFSVNVCSVDKMFCDLNSQAKMQLFASQPVQELLRSFLLQAATSQNMMAQPDQHKSFTDWLKRFMQ